MKNKNPLYVVKGKEVQEASSLLDLVLKKFNLEPVVQILQNIFKMLLEQVKNWPMLKAVEAFMQEMIQKIMSLGRNFKMPSTSGV